MWENQCQPHSLSNNHFVLALRDQLFDQYEDLGKVFSNHLMQTKISPTRSNQSWTNSVSPSPYHIPIFKYSSLFDAFGCSDHPCTSSDTLQVDWHLVPVAKRRRRSYQALTCVLHLWRFRSLFTALRGDIGHVFTAAFIAFYPRWLIWSKVEGKAPTCR